jgi:hypothetical protein
MENDHDYTGLHAFVFIRQVPDGETPQGIAGRLRELGRPPQGPVIFASDAVGPYLAFAHVRVEEGDLNGLQDLISGQLWEIGVHCDYSVESKTYTDPATTQKVGVKRATPEIIGLVSIRVEQGRIDDVLEQLGNLKAFKGASVITGDDDILLQLGGETLSEVLEVGMGELQNVRGIKHTSTTLIDGRR